MKKEGKQMHVVMLPLPLPMPGHINPMLHLSLKLASLGVMVTFVNSEFNHSKVKLSQGHIKDSKPYYNINFLCIPDGLPPEHGRTSDLLSLLMAVDDSYGHRFEVLLHNSLSGLQDPPITCIISNTFISHVQEVAHRLGIPYASFWTQSAASYATVRMVAKGYRPPQDSKASDVLPAGMLPGVPTNLTLGELNAFLHSYSHEDFMFRSFEELEKETLQTLKKEHPKVLAVGPLLPGWLLDEAGNDALEAASGPVATWGAAEAEDGAQCCIKWLDKQEKESVIYIAFGSMGVLSREQVEELAMGLEASKQAFLWVMRQQQEQETLPEAFLHSTQGRGLVISWAPQLKVLRHQAVGAFLTHCGWNSTIEAISAGVPLLVWPSCFSDQATNGRCAVDGWRVGLSLERSAAPPGLVERGEVYKKLALLMQKSAGENPFKGRARQWRAQAVQASASKGSTTLNLERFLSGRNKD